ncbi:MAG: ABC transporter transmembrane domain-containing protein, partial [Eubacteriales bacterium]|nr:ABC transporter transmembrane domain-containing protein [Eubacteriales bacterium]
MNRMRWKRIWEFTKGFRAMYVVALLCVIGNVVCNYVMPLVIAWTVDGVLQGNPISAPAFVLKGIASLGGRSYFAQNLWICGLALLVLTMLRGLFAFGNGRMTAQASEGIVMRIKNRLYQHLQSLSYDYHVKAETGDLIQRCTTDVDTVRRFLAGQLMELGRAIFILIFAITILVKINGALTIIAVSLMPGALVFSYFYSKRIQRQFQGVDEADGALSTVLQENLTGVRVVRAFGNEQYEVQKFEKSNSVLRGRLLKLQNHFAQFWGISDFIAMAQQAVVLFACLYFIIERGMSVGSFIIFNTYIGMMIWPIRQLGRILADAAKMLIAVGRIDDVLREQPETSGEGAVAPDIRGDIQFSHVNFGYERDKPVLRDVSFTVRQGQTVAILGATGSGKSSMMHLLQRLYDYQSGSIRLNGAELRSIDKGHLRSRVGIVLQEPFLYSKSLAQNIGII